MAEIDPSIAQIDFAHVYRHTRRLRPIFRKAGFLSLADLLPCDLLSIGLSPVLDDSGELLVQGRGIDGIIQTDGVLRVQQDSAGELAGRTIMLGVYTPEAGFVEGMMAPELPAGFRYWMKNMSDEQHQLLQPVGMCAVNGTDIF